MKKLFALILLLPLTLLSQVKDYELGAPLRAYQQGGGYFDYSDQFSVNMTVSVWGFVKYPGRYKIPTETNVVDFLSYAGGPTDDALLDDLRIYRVNSDGAQELIKFNYNDLLWEEGLISYKKEVPELKVGDILVVPGSPRLYFKDWFSITLSVVSTLISLSILILNIVRQ